MYFETLKNLFTLKGEKKTVASQKVLNFLLKFFHIKIPWQMFLNSVKKVKKKIILN